MRGSPRKLYSHSLPHEVNPMKIIDRIFSIPDVLKLHKGITILEGYLFQTSVPPEKVLHVSITSPVAQTSQIDPWSQNARDQ